MSAVGLTKSDTSKPPKVKKSRWTSLLPAEGESILHLADSFGKENIRDLTFKELAHVDFGERILCKSFIQKALVDGKLQLETLVDRFWSEMVATFRDTHRRKKASICFRQGVLKQARTASFDSLSRLPCAVPFLTTSLPMMLL